ncbi:hypothetical protein [Pontivivens nitratireducens]|jgi:hypothetical protein|uniref:Uncharacterized protein n=1 Tax=Pontivivens nitratireducens TaxID=2758038 RepID=A0A6G7VP31_9RHOB|nr:hypothetical protein [Pontibrevibacter nitratireducens]QIK41764.1 hypothetical protein G8E03_13985 [Pontibrevibacter nitratireducens]
MTGLLWLLFAFGLATLGMIGRSVEALVGGQRTLVRAAGWSGLALGMGLYIELATPAPASFTAVMHALIRVAAEIF